VPLLELPHALEGRRLRVIEAVLLLGQLGLELLAHLA
jgi:hypothetical protein